MGRFALPFEALNIRGEDGFLCPVCGWPGTFSGDSYDPRLGGLIGTGICACCHFEPGYDDDQGACREAKSTTMESIRFYRRAWLDEGCPWRGGNVEAPPEDSAPERQLSKLFQTAPFLTYWS